MRRIIKKQIPFELQRELEKPTPSTGTDAESRWRRFRRYDPNLFISPLMPDSDRYFEYLSNGRVEPSLNLSHEERLKASYTIDLLNLNASFLVNSRREWLIEIESVIDQLIDNESALRLLAECELCDTGGKLRQFHTALKVRFGRLGNQVMTSTCIQCV